VIHLFGDSVAGDPSGKIPVTTDMKVVSDNSNNGSHVKQNFTKFNRSSASLPPANRIKDHLF
jgi:hypothetical protein